MQTMRYGEVAMRILESAEFREQIGAPANPGPPSRPSTPATASRLDAALACQATVLDRLRGEAPGRPFLSFDRLPDVSADGRVVRGEAVDRFDNDRHLTYSCDGANASYAYADRRRASGGNRRMQFPSNAVKNCMYAISTEIVFDAAGLSASDSSTEYVIGLLGGTRYTCTMDRARVLDVKRQ